MHALIILVRTEVFVRLIQIRIAAIVLLAIQAPFAKHVYFKLN